LTAIPDLIRQSIGDLPAEQRTVFVKGEPGVKYETLSAVMHMIRDADVDRIEIVPIPKKPLQLVVGRLRFLDGWRVVRQHEYQPLPKSP